MGIESESGSFRRCCCLVRVCTTEPPELLYTFNPQVVLLSVPAKDSHDLPAAGTMAKWDGYSLLRTDMNLWVELTTDGELMSVEVERR